MTKFCGDAIGVRGGGSAAYSKKDLRKNMQKFIQTGVHPDVQKTREMYRQEYVAPLPEHDANREFVFLELSVGKTVLGMLVIELFGDIIPVGANHLRQRCMPGSKTGVAGAPVHKLQPHFAFWLGKNPAASEGMRLQANTRLTHVDAGAVSISMSGDEVAIALGRALVLDKTHQVVGRVHKGLDILEQLNEIPVNQLDAPLPRVWVSRSGATNAAGSFEELQKGDASKDPAALLAEQSKGARDAVKQALAEGLGKRKGEEQTGAPSSSRNVKSKFLDTMLGDASGDSSDSSDDEDENDEGNVK